MWEAVEKIAANKPDEPDTPENPGDDKPGANDKHKFTSYERDGESGTDYAVNRQYGQSVGRFMRVDPVAGSLMILTRSKDSFSARGGV